MREPTPLLLDMSRSGMLQSFIANAPVPQLEHHLNNLRSNPASYRWVKSMVREIRGQNVKVVHNHARLVTCY